MTPARFEAIEEIFHSAAGKPVGKRGAFLAMACRGDEALRSQVEELLDCSRQIGDFIENPVSDLTLRALENGQPELLIGQTVGHYQILARIGAGGMGEVYLARDVVAGRKAALKILPLRFTGHPERLKRFEQEARALVALNHPNIVTVYEIGRDQSTHYIASELIEGETLRQRLDRSSLSVDHALEIILQIAGAFAVAHEAGIIHRDIKPENIMLRPDGYVKVLDFGLAKLAEEENPATDTEDDTQSIAQTRVGVVMGTVTYMSPEQARGEGVTASSDIWSLGVVFSKMLGKGESQGASASPAKQHAARSSVPVELERVVNRMLAPEPGQRYRNGRELVEQLKAARHAIELRTYSASSHRIGLRLATAAVIIAALATLIGSYLSHRSAIASLPEKSIAVLPFENLSDNKQDAHFAIGMQDEILSDLAKIADLKVVSRTSTKSYSPRQPRNIRQIGEQLGVAHLLQCSVQRAAKRVRINAQLIDARKDSHVWAQTYDRELSDVFAVQTEIAQTIATQLQARISASEKGAITRAPTRDLVANDLYQQAIALEDQATEASTLGAIGLLERAVARDARFLPACCALARLHIELYVRGHAGPHLQMAKANIEKAFQLQPDSSEAHLVQAHYLARGLRDYDGARAELELARRGLPNNAEVYFETSRVDWRQGRWAEALRSSDRAIELDPRNVLFLGVAMNEYSEMHHYPEALRLGRRVVAISPRDQGMRLLVASQPLKERADFRPLHEELDKILAEDPGAMVGIWGDALDLSILERDATAADRALREIPPAGSQALMGFVVPREWFMGYAARVFNRPEAARTALIAVSARLEQRLRDQPDDAMSWGLLGRARAMLAQKQAAIEAGQRACELWPLSREGYWGLTPIRQLAKIYAGVGEKDLAFEQLSHCAGQPPFLDYGELKLSPDWDPLRGDPRFEKIVASLAPKE